MVIIPHSALAIAAHTYARRLGWAVFPLRGKVPLISERDGGHGYLDATVDSAQI